MGGVEITAKDLISCCLRFKTTRAHRIYRLVKVMPKFMFI